ncbi:MAG: DUF1501 domain-containing protein [Erythrobacter sp.]|nr:DUF1501 domain-containing protein [Erythrobacter sp.]NCQ63769.1 DUF1501 domain-containing protein [Alphaproteobacteria bacterium]
MFIGKAPELSRRAFLRRTGQLAAAGTATSYAMGLAGLGELAAFSPGNDYKALVCVFLYGGNDHYNMLVPYDPANYQRYAEIRTSIARGRSTLGATALATPDDQTLTDDLQYALAPEMPGLKALYDEGAMAPVLNVGPLIVPLTKAQYNANSASNPRPAKLFSHNDQQSTWQSFAPEGSVVGWGGRLGDLALSSNSNAIFTNISASGNAVFLAGQNSLAYQVSSKGAIAINGLGGKLYGSSVAGSALETLLTQPSNHVLARDHATIAKRSIDAQGFVNGALGGVNLATSFTPPTGISGRLAGQLNTVARLIAARNQLEVRRQVYFVGIGGFDLHDALTTRHGPLLAEIDFAMTAFYRATQEMGIADKVTAFTASDFGRTLTSNGDGSDHGWGAHHFVVGGAVNGGRYYGTAPSVSVRSDDQVGNGRLLPTTSVDELTATLGLWFGASPSDLPLIAPNIGNFARPNLGFLSL